MRAWLFTEKNYKKAIKRLIEESPESRGMISRISDAIGCQRSYLSQVLHSKVQLTKDQAWSLCAFFGLSKLETKYFECLVDFERASLPAFRAHLETQMSECRKEFEKLSNHFTESTGFDDTHAQMYYAHWLPSAIHILVSIPEFQTVEKISARLGIGKEQVQKTLNALSVAGLVKKTGGQWKFHGGTKFVPRESPFVAQHHQNWRLQAVEAARDPANEGLHFTMVQTMSRSDYEKIKLLMLEAIDRSSKIAGPSDPQVMSVFNLDFFQPKT